MASKSKLKARKRSTTKSHKEHRKEQVAGISSQVSHSLYSTVHGSPSYRVYPEGDRARSSLLKESIPGYTGFIPGRLIDQSGIGLTFGKHQEGSGDCTSRSSRSSARSSRSTSLAGSSSLGWDASRGAGMTQTKKLQNMTTNNPSSSRSQMIDASARGTAGKASTSGDSVGALLFNSYGELPSSRHRGKHSKKIPGYGGHNPGFR